MGLFSKPKVPSPPPVPDPAPVPETEEPGDLYKKMRRRKGAGQTILTGDLVPNDPNQPLLGGF